MSPGSNSMQDPCQVLPDELWTRILKEICSNASQGWHNYNLLPLLYVCKTWKKRALPLLYEVVTISNKRQFESFTSHLSSRGTIHAERGAWVRSLYIKTIEGPFIPRLGSTIACLYTLTGLLSYKSECDTSFAEISTLLHVTGPQIQELSISIAAESTNSPEKSLDTLQGFSNLKRLSISIKGDFRPEDYPDLQMPSVQDLTWIMLKVRRESHIDYFARCKFKSLRRLSLQFLGVKPSLVERLQPFFSVHQPILDLTLLLPPACLEPFMNLSIQVTASSFLIFVTDTNIDHLCAIKALPSHVYRLDILMSKDQLAPNQRFLEHVNKVLRSNIQTLHINTSIAHGNGFRWNSTDESAQGLTFLGLMCMYAKRLQSKGIDIIDEEGKQLGDK